MIVEFTGLEPAIVEKMVYSHYDTTYVPTSGTGHPNHDQLEDSRKTSYPGRYFSDPIKVFIRK